MLCMNPISPTITNKDSTIKKIQNYIFKSQDLLGRGNFGTAYKGYDTNTGIPIALKVIPTSTITSPAISTLLQNQISILKSLPAHPNLLKCHDVFTSINNYYIVTELCEGDLSKELKKRGRYQEKDIEELVYGLYKGLEELGKRQIVHRDIKLANVFLSKNYIPKIADFGFAVRCSNNFRDLNIGSPLYMSPQGLLHNTYGPKTDVWSFGVMLYQLLHGQTPLQKCTTDDQLKSEILKLVSMSPYVSVEMRQLIGVCLTVDLNKRRTIDQLRQLPYIRKLIERFEGGKKLRREDSLVSTQCSEDECKQIAKKNTQFFNSPLTYETALSLLHYLRLLHKANHLYIKSQVISQFIINFSFYLSKSSISLHNTFHQQHSKLRQILNQYYSKFLMEYGDSGKVVEWGEVLSEILKKRWLMERLKRLAGSLQGETRLVMEAVRRQDISGLERRTQAKTVIYKLGLKESKLLLKQDLQKH